MARATFGDFLQAAHASLEQRSGASGPAVRGSVEEVSASMLRVVRAMSRYLQDLTTGITDVPAQTMAALHPWAIACLQAREALSNSAGFLTERGAGRRWPPGPAASPVAQRLDAVTVSLITGRDLLHTHFAPGAGGTRQPRSEWALAVTCAPVGRVLLTEIGSLARQIAHQVSGLALSPSVGEPGTADARRRLNAACQWLWVLDTSVRAAQQHEPVTAEHRDLLAAIPVNELPARRIPTGGETVTELCEGVIMTAERVRHLAWLSAQAEPWSPDLNAASLRRIAQASTVTSHNCHIMLRTLADRMTETAAAPAWIDVSAADAAGRARDTWLRAARAVSQITTDTRGHPSALATEASDMALWTGRLAYAEPEWTLSSGPGHQARPLASLAAHPGELPAAVAAVHQACETLALLTETERERIHAAARAGRILVPTSSLPDDYDVPRPFAHAPPERVGLLLATYTDAVRASHETTAAVGQIAAATQAPSRVLTTAQEATDTGRTTAVGSGQARHAETDNLHQEPGPTEHALRDLGITHPGLLSRGADIDQASERLIIDAATGLGPTRKRPSALLMNSSRATAALVNHALASGDPRATALLRRPEPAQQEQPEPEPEAD